MFWAISECSVINVQQWLYLHKWFEKQTRSHWSPGPKCLRRIKIFFGIISKVSHLYMQNIDLISTLLYLRSEMPNRLSTTRISFSFEELFRYYFPKLYFELNFKNWNRLRSAKRTLFKLDLLLTNWYCADIGRLNIPHISLCIQYWERARRLKHPLTTLYSSKKSLQWE